jgi:hypothetical protein
MYSLSPAAVQLRELHRQDLLEAAARERLARTVVSGIPPQCLVQGSSSSVGASRRSEALSRLAVLVRLAATHGRPLYRVVPWS